MFFGPRRANLLIGAFSFRVLFVRPNSFIIYTGEAPAFRTISVQIDRCKSFRINTYITDTKHTTLTAFRMNSYAKP